MEGWRGGGVERWRGGRVERLKDGRIGGKRIWTEYFNILGLD